MSNAVDLDLDQIEADLADVPAEVFGVRTSGDGPMRRLIASVPALVAEVRLLRAEVVTLECERAPQELVDHLAAERDAAHAEAERLRGELDAAEGAMADIAGERAEAVAEAARVREALQAERKHHTAAWRECVLDGEVWPCASVRALDAALDGEQSSLSRETEMWTRPNTSSGEFRELRRKGISFKGAKP